MASYASAPAPPDLDAPALSQLLSNKVIIGNSLLKLPNSDGLVRLARRIAEIKSEWQYHHNPQIDYIRRLSDLYPMLESEVATLRHEISMGDIGIREWGLRLVNAPPPRQGSDRDLRLKELTNRIISTKTKLADSIDIVLGCRREMAMLLESSQDVRSSFKDYDLKLVIFTLYHDFCIAMRQTNPGKTIGISAHGPAARFVATVAPHITGEEITVEAAAKHLQRTRTKYQQRVNRRTQP